MKRWLLPDLLRRLIADRRARAAANERARFLLALADAHVSGAEPVS